MKAFTTQYDTKTRNATHKRRNFIPLPTFAYKKLKLNTSDPTDRQDFSSPCQHPPHL